MGLCENATIFHLAQKIFWLAGLDTGVQILLVQKSQLVQVANLMRQLTLVSLLILQLHLREENDLIHPLHLSSEVTIVMVFGSAKIARI